MLVQSCALSITRFYMLAITKDTQFQPTYVNFLQIGQFLDLPVKVDFTGKPVKQCYRFLPVLTSKNLQPYSH